MGKALLHPTIFITRRESLGLKAPLSNLRRWIKRPVTIFDRA